VNLCAPDVTVYEAFQALAPRQEAASLEHLYALGRLKRVVAWAFAYCFELP